jgi:hypothetical protein
MPTSEQFRNIYLVYFHVEVAGYVTRMGEMTKVSKVWWERTKERDHSEDRSVDGRMESKLILGRLAGGWSGFNWLRFGEGGGCCECGDEPSVSGATGWYFHALLAMSSLLLTDVSVYSDE